MSSRRAAALVIAAAVASASRVASAAPDARPYDGTRATTWSVEADPSEPATVPVAAAVPATSPPPARVDGRGKPKRLAIAVGLAPEAPGNEAERQWLDRLERSARVSPSPQTTVRRLRPGAGDARSICRDRLDDMVVMVGYVPRRDDAVLLPYDCLLDLSLGIRSLAAIDEDGLVGALWAEHEQMVRNGVSERRRIGRLSPKVRGAIIGGVAVIVIGVAVGLLVANALRDEKVVVKVSP